MRKTVLASTLALATLALGTTLESAALAQENLHNADVLRPGDNLLYTEIGWPDFTMGFQHGMSDKVDIGFALSVLYGYDYTTTTWVGMGMRVPIRVTPIKTGKFSFQIRFEPGLKFDHFNNAPVLNCSLQNLQGCTTAGADFGNDGGLAFGLWLYFGLDFGIHFTKEATLSFGMTAPFFVNFTNGVYGAMPLLFGPAFEYDINDHFGVGINAKFGPTIYALPCQAVGLNGACVSNPSGADFGLLVQPFFAYRM